MYTHKNVKPSSTEQKFMTLDELIRSIEYIMNTNKHKKIFIEVYVL